MSVSNSSNPFAPNNTQTLSPPLSSSTHKPFASQIPIFIIVHSVSHSFHLFHHFSFLSFLTSFSWMSAPLRKRISTTSPFPSSAARCNGVWKKIEIKMISASLEKHQQFDAISCECEHTLCHKMISHYALFISQYGIPLPLPIHIFFLSLFLSSFVFCMNLMDIVTSLHSPIQ